jgi:hypothetical protein
MLAEPPGPYFTPDRIEQLLKLFAELDALAESPATARGLFRSRPTPEDPKTGARQKGRPRSDPNRWSDIRADLVRAWQSLPAGSLERHVVMLRSQAYTFGQIAQLKRTRKETVLEAYHAATAKMSVFLEGVQVEDGPSPLSEAAPAGASW